MRTDFLVHWTGKDICSDPDALNDEHRRRYMDRLADILGRGFWMTKPDEKIYGMNNVYIEYNAPMTCFTEIRLSQARFHARRYGLLGVGVMRRFVLDRLGGPVHYVRNHQTECVIGNVRELLKALETCDPQYKEYFAVNSAFIKGMSDPETDNFVYLNEQEWRIVHTHSQTEAKNLVRTGCGHPEYRIPVKKCDVRIIVFPDEQTHMQAREDPRLEAWLQTPPRTNAIQLTLQECGQF